MPKVLRIINRFNLGGPTYNAAYLTKYLAPEYETMLIGGMKDEQEESSEFILKNLGVDYHILPEMRRSIDPFSDLSAYYKIKKIIADFRPDIVHTHAAKAGALGRRAAFASGVRATVHTFHGHVFHSYFGRMKTTLYKFAERSLAKKTSAIVAISQKQKDELVLEHRIAPGEKVHIVPLGFDLSRFHEDREEKRKKFREKYSLAEDEIAIGIVGRLVPVKNHTLFLEAIVYVKENSGKKVRAFIIGDGEEGPELRARVAALGLQDVVVFTSWQKAPDAIYPGLEIVCLTSFNEGTPVSIIEAQAAGIPVVATNVGGVSDIVIPGRTAFISDISEREIYFKNLLNLVKNEGLRNEMRKEGWDHTRYRFSHIRLVNDMKTLYAGLLK